MGPPGRGPCGAAFEFVADGVIDLADFAQFVDCFDGVGQPPVRPQ